MADPRKTYKVVYCNSKRQQLVRDSGKRKGFLDNLLKVGDLEFLNDVGYGKVGEGLRVLAGVSDSIRTGESVVPGREGQSTINTTLSNILAANGNEDSGAEVVLDTTGQSENYEKTATFYPSVANRAYGQAKQIYSKVKDGNFDVKDIPGVFSDLQNLDTLARGIFSTNKSDRREKALCHASPYARDLISFAPKFNFLFVVQIEFSPEYRDWADIGSSTAFVVKRSTRPAMEVEHEEVNMYNFRTQIPKRVTYPPVTMSFYDDNKNMAHQFYTGYMRAMSPIANMYNYQTQTDWYEINSMNFTNPPDDTYLTGTDPKLDGYASSLGPLLNNSKSIISTIRLFHVYDYGRSMNVYNFFNPRITSFTPTDLNMAETGDGAEFEFQFAYDGMFIEPGYSVQDGVEYGGDYNIVELSTPRGTGQYPINPIFGDTDGTEGSNPSAQNQSFLGKIKQAATDAAKGAAQTVSNAFSNASKFTGSLFD